MAAGAGRLGRRRLIALSLAVLALLLTWDFSGADLALSQRLGSPRGFAWRDAWLTRDLLHEGGRRAALALLALLGWQAWRGSTADAGPSRRERRFWFAVMLASALLLPALKGFSASSCPWSLQDFGGSAPYVPHWLLGRLDGGPGHCFPSGHAVAGYAFIGLYFQWRPHDARRARAWLIAALALGTLFGAAQLLRGAHFASHVAWSAWLCWTLALLAERFAPAAQRQAIDSRHAP